MINLSTFSFTVGESKSDWELSIRRDILASWIKDLPQSCVNLEIDTRGCDFGNWDSNFLCDELRHVLPRLRYLRLRLACLCSDIFAIGFTVDGMIENQSAFQSVVAPYLKSVVINCSVFSGSAKICGSDLDPQIPLARSFRQLIARGCYPVMEQFWLLSLRPPDPDHAFYDRCDIIQNRTSAIPLLPFTGSDVFHDIKENGTIISARMPDGQEVLTFDWAVEQIVEGQTWQETMSGCRMPPAAIGTDGFWRGGGVAKPLPLSDLAARRNRPALRYPPWINEGLTGLQLLQALKREALREKLSGNESTPDEWYRNGEYLEEPVDNVVDEESLRSFDGGLSGVDEHVSPECDCLR